MPHRVFIRDSSGWKQLRKINLNTDKNERKRIRKGWVKTENDGWKLFFGYSFPEGIILPITSDTLPSGWEWFNLANGRPIIGADTAIPIGLGGTPAVTHTTVVPYIGTHGAGVAPFSGTVCSPCQPNTKCVKWDSDSHQGYNRGGHEHSSISASVSIKPRHTELRFVKLTSSGPLPLGVCIMSTGALIDFDGVLVNEESKDIKYHDQGAHYMAAGSNGLQNDFNNLSSKTVTTSSTGSHHHSSVWKTLTTTGTTHEVAVTEGLHNHHANTTARTENYKHMYLSLWNSASEAIELADNMIGMWEGTTAPEGWLICDGTNGTPDLRNRFIRYGKFSTTSGTSGGNGRVSLGINTTISGHHSHKAKISCGGGDLSLRHAEDYAHEHASLSVSREILPSYYALSFIMSREI